MATNAQLLIMIRGLQTDVAALKVRVTTLENAAPATGDGLAALEARMDVLEAKTCPQQEEIDGIKAALDLLSADHVPEP